MQAYFSEYYGSKFCADQKLRISFALWALVLELGVYVQLAALSVRRTQPTKFSAPGL